MLGALPSGRVFSQPTCSCLKHCAGVLKFCAFVSSGALQRQCHATARYSAGSCVRNAFGTSPHEFERLMTQAGPVEPSGVGCLSKTHASPRGRARLNRRQRTCLVESDGFFRGAWRQRSSLVSN